MLAHVLGSQNNSKESDLQKEIPPQWQSALKRGLGEVQPGSIPSSHTAELPSPVLPRLTQCLLQLINQRFRPWFNSSCIVLPLPFLCPILLLFGFNYNYPFNNSKTRYKILKNWRFFEKEREIWIDIGLSVNSDLRLFTIFLCPLSSFPTGGKKNHKNPKALKLYTACKRAIKIQEYCHQRISTWWDNENIRSLNLFP